MDDFENIIKKLKVIIAKGEKRRVVDKEVANALGLSVQNFSNFKQRGNIPLSSILTYCAQNKISINWILYNQLHSSLEHETNKYIGIRYHII